MSKVNNVKKNKILDIVSFSGVFLFFVFALVCAIFRFTGTKFNLFGSRYDVVLTDSMSEKNEKYVDFLSGHDDQFQAFDLAKSKKIENPSDLEVYDVVIYKDRKIGTNMHRIVDIFTEHSEDVIFTDSSLIEIEGIQGVSMSEIMSHLETTEIQFSNLTLETFSLIDDTDTLVFNVMGAKVVPEITSTHDEKGYTNTYKITNPSTAPGKIKISHYKEYDFSKEIVTKVTIDSVAGNIEVIPSDLSGNEDGGLVGSYNPDYRFEIRGDKSNTSDGLYKFEEIEAKVVKNIPKMGYLIRFLNSLWGGLMFLLLGVLFLVFDILMTRLNKKEAMASATAETPTEIPTEVPVEKTVVEEPKPEPVEEPKPEPAKELKEHKKRYYQVVKREDGMWKVINVKTKDTVKVFSTQKDAKAYVKEMTAKEETSKK